MGKPLQGKVAVVTGGSSGIGLGIAKCLVEAGASVALAARREDRLEEARQKIAEIGGKVTAVKTDVCVQKEVKEMVERTERDLGPVDILVNNAGISYLSPMASLHEDAWERQIDVNCKGAVNCIAAVLKGMISRGKGHIVNTSSILGRTAFPGMAVYCGTKHFLQGMTSALRKELVGTGIRVTNLQPGTSLTNAFENWTDEEAIAKCDMPGPEKFLSPVDIGRAAIFALSQPAGVAVNEVTIEHTDFPFL